VVTLLQVEQSSAVLMPRTLRWSNHSLQVSDDDELLAADKRGSGIRYDSLHGL